MLKKENIIFILYKVFGLKSILLLSRFLSIDTLKKVVGKIMLSVEYSSGFFHDMKFTGFYRARSHNHEIGNIRNNEIQPFTKESQFLNPPKDKTSLARCNEKGESMFYCSTDSITAIIESRPKKYGYVTVASFIGFMDGRLYEHRISPIGYRYLKRIPELNVMMGSLEPDARKGFTRVDDFLDRLFHMEIKKNAYYYKLSNAVAKCFLSDIQNDIGTTIRQHGLIYSSILRNNKSYNIVLRPIYVNHYKIKVLQTFLIDEISNEKIKIRLVRHGQFEKDKKDPAENRDIVWQEIPQTDGTILEYDLINLKYL